MKKLIICVLLLSGLLNASELQTKYEIFTEYLGMKQLELDEKQLAEIVPKLEATMMKDKNYKELLLQNKLNRLNSTIKKPLEQTICFSQNNCNGGFMAVGTIGDGTKICGGRCNGKTLPEMNQDGWELTEVIGGLQNSFGMVFTRK